MFKKDIIFALNVENIFIGYAIQRWLFFFLSTYKLSQKYFSVCMVSVSNLLSLLMTNVSFFSVSLSIYICFLAAGVYIYIYIYIYVYIFIYTYIYKYIYVFLQLVYNITRWSLSHVSWNWYLLNFWHMWIYNFQEL